MSKPVRLLWIPILLLVSSLQIDCDGKPAGDSLRTVIELNKGKSIEAVLSNGARVTVRLIDLVSERDRVCLAVRSSRVKVSINNREVTLTAGTYNLPLTVGDIKIDCPITGDYARDIDGGRWGLHKDARFRLWPADSPQYAPDAFSYPLDQGMFVSDTQMTNEPAFVDGAENYHRRGAIHYHHGLDFGGAEAMVKVFSVTDGLVVAAADGILSGYEETPATDIYDLARHDGIAILDDRGWYHCYAHLYRVQTDVVTGKRVKQGQTIGILGKEGGSGGWAHLHYHIMCRQPSGEWGVEDAYPYLWESYLRRFEPAVVAIARPHKVAVTGETVTLDAGKSKNLSGGGLLYRWSFSDGTEASGPLQKMVYSRPGTYSEIVRVSDPGGTVDYDFTVVQVNGKDNPDAVPPGIHAAFYPTAGIKPGDSVTFKVRTFEARSGVEVWDFGDGSRPVIVKSNGGYVETTHRFSGPGDYLVTVNRTGDLGYRATAHLHVRIVG
jgi:murein DD-endopeptidase MepM/ murein hydrolase activator NlpD